MKIKLFNKYLINETGNILCRTLKRYKLSTEGTIFKYFIKINGNIHSFIVVEKIKGTNYIFYKIILNTKEN